MFFIKTLLNVDQIHSYLLQLKLNLRVGPNTYCKNTVYGFKNILCTISLAIVLYG